MQPYDPFSRIPEVGYPDAIAAFETCLRYFTANTLDELRSVVLQAETQLKRKPEPFDLFELFYKIIQEEAFERALALYAVNTWGEKNRLDTKTVDLQPNSWKITLSVEDDDYLEVETKKDPSFHLYENPCIIVKNKDDSQNIFIDLEAINKWYKKAA